MIQGDDGELDTEQQQRQDRADPRRGQGRQDGHGMNEALVQDPEHQINRRQGREHQHQFAAEGLLEHQRRAGETAGDIGRQPDLPDIPGDGGLSVAQGLVGRQVEGQGGGHELALVIDRQGGAAGAVGGHGGQRHQGLGAGRDRGTGRGPAFAGGRDRRLGRRAHGVVGDRAAGG